MMKWKQFIKESETEQQYQIFCDMDGVLVDFSKGIADYLNKKIDFILRNRTKIAQENPLLYKKADNMLQELLGKSIEEVMASPSIQISDLWTSGSGAGSSSRTATRAFMYHCIANNYNFWNQLEWLSDGKTLWDFIKNFNPIILTGPMGKRSKEAKVDWVAKNLGSRVPVITTHNKFEYAKYKGKQGVLIDDLRKYLDAWEAAGGIGLWKKNGVSAQSVIDELKNMGFGNVGEQDMKINQAQLKQVIREALEEDKAKCLEEGWFGNRVQAAKNSLLGVANKAAGTKVGSAVLGDDTKRKLASKTPRGAYEYALYKDRGPHDDTRKSASEDPQYAYLYARNVDYGSDAKGVTKQGAYKNSDVAALYEKYIERAGSPKAANKPKPKDPEAEETQQEKYEWKEKERMQNAWELDTTNYHVEIVGVKTGKNNAASGRYRLLGGNEYSLVYTATATRKINTAHLDFKEEGYDLDKLKAVTENWLRKNNEPQEKTAPEEAPE